MHHFECGITATLSASGGLEDEETYLGAKGGVLHHYGGVAEFLNQVLQPLNSCDEMLVCCLQRSEGRLTRIGDLCNFG